MQYAVESELYECSLVMVICTLFHDLLSAPMFHHSVWSVITAHNLTPAKRVVA